MIAPAPSKRQIVTLGISGIVLFLLGFLIGYFTIPIDDSENKSNTPSSTIEELRKSQAEKKEKYHSELYNALNKSEIGKNVKYFSERPHVPGTARSKQLAEEIARRWKKFGFDKVEMPKYNVLIPYINPNISNRVQILDTRNKTVLEFSGKEKALDPNEEDDTMIPPLLAYAKQGSATARKLLYVNYGRTEDFDVLKKNYSVPNCEGYIVIIRYGRISRGDKIKNAQIYGALGAILYDDPENAAPNGQNNVYPKGMYMPKTGVQQGSIATSLGDPITPGLPSIDGIFRISPDEAGLPTIPATPMPYGDAEEIMKIMDGDEVPDSWKGKLNITYRIGNRGFKGNNTAIRIEVNFPNKRQDIYNVIGTIYGKEEPDRWVLLGNHRDAWGFGAVDPSSGTAAMMEISHGLSKLLKRGWRPRRTIKFCSWGAEEPGLIGSNEWVEEHEQALSTKGVTYINVDISVAGTHKLVLSGSPMFTTMITEAIKKVEDPHLENGKKTTVYDRLVKVDNCQDGGFDFGNLAADSDYVSFYQFVGVPSLDMYYIGDDVFPYAVYHSVYDTYQWLTRFVDPDFSYHMTTTQVAARSLMLTADSIVLPFDVRHYPKSLRRSLRELNDTYGKDLYQSNVTLDYIDTAISRFNDACMRFQQEVEGAIANKDDIQLRDLNDRMVNIEKSFIYSYGLPNQKFNRHVIFTPALQYVDTYFPGISDLIVVSNKTEKDWTEIRRQASIVFKSIMSAVDTLKQDAN